MKVTAWIKKNFFLNAINSCYKHPYLEMFYIVWSDLVINVFFFSLSLLNSHIGKLGSTINYFEEEFMGPIAD